MRGKMLTHVKKAVLAPFSPFKYFEEIAAGPRAAGAAVGYALLILASIFSWVILIGRTHVYISKAGPYTAPQINFSDGVATLIFAEESASLKPLRIEYALGIFGIISSLASATIIWLSLALAIYVSTVIVGRKPHSVGVLSGYLLSLKFYEELVKYSLILGAVREIRIIVPATCHPLRYAGIALSLLPTLPHFRSIFLAHGVFFAIWTIVCIFTLVKYAYYLSDSRSIAASVLSYLLSATTYTVIANIVLPILISAMG